MKPAVLFNYLFDSSQETSFATMPAADDDLVAADSEGEFHSFTNHDFSPEMSSMFSSPNVDRFSKLAGRSPPGSGGTTGPSSGSLLKPPELVRPKFVSLSLPTSALSSPKFGAEYPKTARKWYDPAHPPHPALKSMARQHSAALSRFAAEQKVLALRRSKSCGEGRSSEPSEGLVDILSRRTTMIQNQKAREVVEVEVDRAATYDRTTTITTETSERSSFKDPREQLRGRSGGDQFRCGCVFLPSLSGKKKQVVFKGSNKVRVQLQPNIKNAQNLHTASRHFPNNYDDTVVVTSKKQATGARDHAALRANDAKQEEAGDTAVSAVDEKERGSSTSTSTRGVSLEKFECGSWSSSPILNGDDDEGGGSRGGQSYFDLPLELIRLGHNDTDSPVRAAFVFEKDLKGVLKKSTSKLGGSGKSPVAAAREVSNRHVRFSTSLPTSYPASPMSTCITPRLRKAREEFNAFLEAQSA